MPSLEQSLYKYDFSHLRIIAQLWGINLRAKESKKAHKELSEKMLSPKLANEVIESLPTNSHHALATLLSNNGRIAWAVFERKYGKIREIGAGKRDRENPHLNPISPAETLFYRALLARAFFDTSSGAQEFAYIPKDLLTIISDIWSMEKKHVAPLRQNLGRLARPEEYKHIQRANDFILDDLTTLLSALRLGWREPPTALDTSPRFARELGLALRLITPAGLKRSAVKSHLEQSRAEAFAQLKETWLKSESFNELYQVPSIICEGEWKNDILATRKKIFAFLAEIPHGKWWNLNSFIADIKKYHPDFQRKGGEYDAWFIRRSRDPKGFNQLKIKSESSPSKSSHKKSTLIKPFGSEKTLRGFEHWDEVDGALIRYFITGVLFWLGFVDLASAEKDGAIKAFRVVPERSDRQGTQPKDSINQNRSSSTGFTSVQPSAQRLEEGKIFISSSGKITLSRYAERVARYQISRFCEWEESKNPNEYKYQLTPASLARALDQDLKVSHLLSVLKKYADNTIPPTLGKALRRWAVNGTEARVETLAVLRLSKPEDLRALRESRASRFLGEVLSPTRVIVKGGASKKIMSALIEMGIFMETRKK